MKNGRRGETQRCEALAGKRVARAVNASARAQLSTPLGDEANQSIGDIFSSKAANELRNTYKTSGRAAVYGLRGGSIRKKIIGRGMRALVAQFAGEKHVWRPGRAVALFEKPACQHGGGALLHPLINQRGNFFAEIGSVSQTRQFKALKGVPRGRKQEFPRWLSRAGSHSTSVRERCAY
jgi:hypothetical protein